MLRNAALVEEADINEARLLSSRVLPSSDYEAFIIAGAESQATARDAECDNYAADAVPASAFRPRQSRGAAAVVAKVARALRLTVPLTSELSGSLRAMKPVGAQTLAAERLAVISLESGQVPLRSALRHGATGLSDDGGAVLVEKRRPRRPSPYKSIDLPRQAPLLRALAAQTEAARLGNNPGRATPLDDVTPQLSSRRLDDAPASSRAEPAAELELITGDCVDADRAPAAVSDKHGRPEAPLRIRSGERSRRISASTPALHQQRGSISAASSALRSGVLSAADVSGMTLKYSKAQAWKPQV